MKESRRVAILTGGGDAPGMNAAVKGAVRAALNRGWEVYGIRDAYLGMVKGGDHLFPLDWLDVSWNYKDGGTFLGSARYVAFKGDSRNARLLREKALLNLKKRGISGLVVIGGDGSLSGAYSLHKTLSSDPHLHKELDAMSLFPSSAFREASTTTSPSQRCPWASTRRSTRSWRPLTG